jgi:hypothetical protein
MDEMESKARDRCGAQNTPEAALTRASVHGAAGGAPAVHSRYGSSVQASMPRLLVFLHLALKQRALQGELQAAMQGMLVTTVGRIGDVDRALQDGQDAILTLPPVLRARSLSGTLQGLSKGAPDEPYALVSVNAVPDVQKLAAVGALDLLGREGTSAFVSELLGRETRVERVSKVEDLLPLLQMQRVDAIVVAQRLVDDLREMSRMNMTILPLDKRVGLPMVASLGPKGGDAIAAIAKLPRPASQMLGVDEWR